jgi:hypothetical protein
LTPGGSSTVHIYTQTVHIYTQTVHIYTQTVHIYTQTVHIHTQTVNIHTQTVHIHTQTVHTTNTVTQNKRYKQSEYNTMDGSDVGFNVLQCIALNIDGRNYIYFETAILPSFRRLPSERTKPLPKRVLQEVRDTASPFKCQNLGFFSRSFSSCLRLLLALPFPSSIVFSFNNVFQKADLRMM